MLKICHSKEWVTQNVYNDFFSTVVWNEITVPALGDRRIHSIGEMITVPTLSPPRIPVHLPGIAHSSAW